MFITFAMFFRIKVILAKLMPISTTMKTIKFLLIIPLVIIFSGCSKEKEDNDTQNIITENEDTIPFVLKGNTELDSIAFYNIKWKLFGFGDSKTEDVIEAAARNYDENYFTLSFDSKTTLQTYSTSNKLSGNYTIDFSTSKMYIHSFGGTKVGEFIGSDGDRYVDSFYEIKAFWVTEKELKLFYSDKDYMLFYPQN